jgi:hypothetical protein
MDLKTVPVFVITNNGEKGLLRINELEPVIQYFDKVAFIVSPHTGQIPYDWQYQINCLNKLCTVGHALAIRAQFKRTPDLLSYPEDADIVYLGTSNRGSDCRNANYCWDMPDVYYEPVETHPHLVRIHNMLSAHAVMYCNPTAAVNMICSLSESFHLNKFNDVLMANLQTFMKVYALRDPIFYQGGTWNTDEMKTCTKVGFPEWRPNLDLTKHKPYQMFFASFITYWNP